MTLRDDRFCPRWHQEQESFASLHDFRVPSSCNPDASGRRDERTCQVMVRCARLDMNLFIQDAYAHLLLHPFMIFLSPSIFSVVVEPDKLIPVVGWIKREIASSHYRPFNISPPPRKQSVQNKFRLSSGSACQIRTIRVSITMVYIFFLFLQLWCTPSPFLLVPLHHRVHGMPPMYRVRVAFRG